MQTPFASSADAHFLAKVARLFESPAFGERQVERLEPMADGHAGHAFGLDLRDRAGQASRHILKMGPPGVPRRGSADIFRQARLLYTLHVLGLGVPDIDWACADEDRLDAPFIVMRRLPGRSLIIWDPDPTFLAGEAALPDLWVAGARALADIHRVDHQVHLADWELATPLTMELERWASLVRHSQDPLWQGLLHQLGDELRATMPHDGPVGLVHGDFQPGNILYDDGCITGVIDWDLAMISSQGIDLGWYLMMADAECWDPQWQPVTTAPKQDLVRAYAEAGGPALSHIGWYQAFAHFRLGSIAGLNLKLHQGGRRQDAIWEKFALSIPSLLRAGLDILNQKDTPL